MLYKKMPYSIIDAMYPESSCMYINRTDGDLWSVGSKNIFYFFPHAHLPHERMLQIVDADRRVYCSVRSVDQRETIITAKHVLMPDIMLEAHYEYGRRFSHAFIEGAWRNEFITGVGVRVDNSTDIRTFMRLDTQKVSTNDYKHPFDFFPDARGGIQIRSAQGMDFLTVVRRGQTFYIGREPHELADVNFHMPEQDMRLVSGLLWLPTIRASAVDTIVESMNRISHDLYTTPTGRLKMNMS